MSLPGSGKVVAVTGASGFIGAHVVLALLQRGYTVHACVRNVQDPKNRFLRALADGTAGSIELFSATLLDEGAYDAAFRGAAGVIHVAAVLAISDSQDPVKDMVEPSTRGVRNVLGSVRRCGASASLRSTPLLATCRGRRGRRRNGA